MGILYKHENEWIRIPAQFKTVKMKDHWFSHYYLERDYFLFDVTMPDGKKGPVNTKGTLLFK